MCRDRRRVRNTKDPRDTTILFGSVRGGTHHGVEVIWTLTCVRRCVGNWSEGSGVQSKLHETTLSGAAHPPLSDTSCELTTCLI